MNRYITLCVAAAMTAAIPAAAETWNLQQCIDYAIEHNLTVKNTDYNVKAGEISVTSAKNQFLPTVTGTANQSFNFGRSVAEDNIRVSRNSSGFSWGANANLPLFDGLRNVRTLKGAQLSLQQLLLESDAARDDISLRVIAAYLQVLLNGELVKVAETQLELSQVEVDRQKVLVEAGKSPELDLIQAESQLAQAQVTLVNNRSDHQLSLLDLKQLLMLSPEADMTVAPLDQLGVLIPDAEEVYRQAMLHNSSIMAKRQGIKVAENRISIAKSGYLPSLSLGANIGSSYTHIKGFDNAGFAHQMRDNLSEAIGFSLSVPLFDAFSTRNSVNNAKIDKLRAELELEQASDELYKSINQAYYQAEAARKKAEASTIAEAATKAALDAMTTKFNYGKATATEYEQAKTDYITACSTTIQSRYEYIIRAKVLEYYSQPHPYLSPTTK